LAVVAIAGLAVFYFGWFRDSPLVAVREVKVEGVTTADRSRIEGALTAAAKQMTTLHLDEARLQDAVAAFPSVASVSADPGFPSGLTIHVVERRPALFAQAAGRRIPVADDGTVLTGIDVPSDEAKDLPELRVGQLPASGRLAGEDLEQALVLGAAPEPLRPLIEGVEWSPEEGVVVTMRGEIPIRFGTGGRAEAKWIAVAAILADPKLKAVSYLDVRVPERPAVGGTGEGAVAETPPAPAAPAVEAPVAPVTPDPAALSTDAAAATADGGATSTTAPAGP
jgi:cell division septal protein FtsQ